MDELARKYVETHDRKIVDELYELARELEEMEKLESSEKARASGPFGHQGFVSVYGLNTPHYLVVLRPRPSKNICLSSSNHFPVMVSSIRFVTGEQFAAATRSSSK
jgi:hypothetical protein